MSKKKQEDKGFDFGTYKYIKNLILGEPDGYTNGTVYYRSGDNGRRKNAKEEDF